MQNIIYQEIFLNNIMIANDTKFVTFYDGSEEAKERMIKRYNERMKKMRTI